MGLNFYDYHGLFLPHLNTGCNIVHIFWAHKTTISFQHLLPVDIKKYDYLSLESLKLHTMAMPVMEFQFGDTKLERFLPKNQQTQRKLLNFEFCINGKLSKSAKIWLLKSISYVKNHPNLSQFFFHWKISI